MYDDWPARSQLIAASLYAPNGDVDLQSVSRKLSSGLFDTEELSAQAFFLVQCESLFINSLLLLMKRFDPRCFHVVYLLVRARVFYRVLHSSNFLVAAASLPSL